MSYERLLRLARSGDSRAAWSLQSEARRRGDNEALCVAVDALDDTQRRDLLEPCWAGQHHEALLRCARSVKAFAYLRALAGVWPERHIDILKAGGVPVTDALYGELTARVDRVNAALMTPSLLTSHAVEEILRAAEQGAGHRFVGEPATGRLGDRQVAEIAAARTARSDAVVLDFRRTAGGVSGYAPGNDWLRPALAMTANPASLRQATERWCAMRGRMRLKLPLQKTGSRCVDFPTQRTLAELRWLEGPTSSVRVAHLSPEMPADTISEALDDLGGWLEARFQGSRLEICDSSPSVFHYARFLPHQAAIQPRLLDPGVWQPLGDGAALHAGRVHVHLRYVVDARM